MGLGGWWPRAFRVEARSDFFGAGAQRGGRHGQDPRGKDHRLCTAESRDPKIGEPRKDKGSGAADVRIDSARAEGGAGRTSEFADRLERFGLRNGVFKAKERAVLSDGAAWIRNVCEEILPGRRAACVLDQFHALDCAAAAVQALTPDEGGRKARMEGIKQHLNDGRVACVIDDLKPHRDRDKAVAACIDQFEANKDRMPATAAGSADCRSDPTSWKAPASRSSGAASSGRGAAGRKRAPTPCSPPNAASKTIARPTSSTGGSVSAQPPDQRKWDTPGQGRPHTKALIEQVYISLTTTLQSHRYHAIGIRYRVNWA